MIKQIRRQPLRRLNLDGTRHYCETHDTTHTKNKDVLAPPPGADMIRVRDQFPHWRAKPNGKRPSAWRELDRDED